MVDVESATLNIAAEIRIPLDANHRTVCKFLNKHSQNCQSVMVKIQDLVNDAVEIPAKNPR